MPILLLLAGAVVLVGVVSVAMGHGGEMAEFATDYVAPTMDAVVTAADVALLRPPSALWGYNHQVTDEALNRVAQVITERDVEIAVLRQQLAELRAATGGHPAITATLLARSKAAAAARPEGARPEGARPAGARPEEASSLARPVGASATGPANPAAAKAEVAGWDVPRNGATGSGVPHSGAPGSEEAAAGRDD